MLPFLRKNNEASVAVTPPQTIRREADEEESTDDVDGLEVAAQDLIDAVHRRDAKAVAEALRAANELLEVQPSDAASEE